MIGRKKSLFFHFFLLVVQAIILVIGIGHAKELNLYIQEKQYIDVKWDIDHSDIVSNEKESDNFITTSEKDLRSYWHSKDKDLRMTIGSTAIGKLISSDYILIKESVVNEHLILTMYYNPLRVKMPTEHDVFPTYRVVKYAKPDIIKDLAEDESFGGEDTGESDSEEKKESTKNTFVPKYPFQVEQVIYEDDQYVVYWEDLVTDELLNIDFYRLYISQEAIQGDYGWEKGVFYEGLMSFEEEVEDESEQVQEEEEEEQE